MRRQHYPTYQRAVNYYLSCDNRKFSKLLGSEEISVTERSLLNARKLFSRGRFSEAIGVLELIKTNCPFLSAETNLLLATANSNLGLAENSFLYNGRAISFYQKACDQRGEFLSNYNLSVDAEKLGLKRISSEYFERASSVALTIDQKFLISRSKACRLTQELKYQEAYEEIKSSLSLSSECPNALDVLTLKTVAVDIFFRAKDFSGLGLLLDQIKNEKLLKPKARIFFTATALKFLEGKDIGTKPKHVDESEEYSLKWDILLALNSGDLTTGRLLWNNLREKYPLLYGEDFSALTNYEKDGIFYKCIQKIRQKASSVPQVRFETGSKMAILHECLLKSQTPIRKEDLIEQIWKTPYEPSFDSRFYKLVQRLKEMSLPIVNDHRAYYYKCS